MQNWTPRQEFPLVSRGGDQRQMPMVLGITRRTHPDTPDLAGSPTYRRNQDEVRMLVVVVTVVSVIIFAPKDDEV